MSAIRKTPSKRRAKTPRTNRRSSKEILKSSDLFDFQITTCCAMSPDESRIAYTVESIDSDHRRYFSHIHISDLSAGKCRQYTFGQIADRQLQWSPDGQTLAFISTRDKKTAIYLISAAGGAERKLLELDGSFGSLIWFPDGKKLLFSFTKSDSFELEGKKKKDAPLYRRFTRFMYHLDGVGFMPKDLAHLWTVDTATAKSRQLTKGKLEHQAPALSADGKKIYFLACDRRDSDRDNAFTDIFVMPANGGKARKLKSTEGPKMALAVSPDGKTVAYLGHDDPHDAWGVRNTHIWTIPSSLGANPAKDLLKGFDRHATDSTIADMGEISFDGSLEFSTNGKRIYFLASDVGNTHLFYVPTRGGKPTRITHRPMHVRSASLGKPNKTVALLCSDLKTTPEVYTAPLVYRGDDDLKKITAVNDILPRLELGRTKEVWFKGFDGTKLQGWLTLPPKFNARRKYPAILEVHGGPRVQYGNSFFHEMNYLAARGYVVFYTNPRGGLGRGETFAAAIAGGWGDLDYRDVLSAADWLEKQKFVNSKRIGITGGSYGGYMTNWAIGHTNRFRAAVTQRCLSDLFSFAGTSDIGFELYREFDGQPWENEENYKKCSPLTYIGKHVKTPLLIIHSEKDLRCPFEQAQQIYMKMKWLKKTVEMVLFPEESHGLSRHGRPDRRVARLELIAGWFDKYLK